MRSLTMTIGGTDSKVYPKSWSCFCSVIRRRPSGCNRKKTCRVTLLSFWQTLTVYGRNDKCVDGGQSWSPYSAFSYYLLYISAVFSAFFDLWHMVFWLIDECILFTYRVLVNLYLKRFSPIKYPKVNNNRNTGCQNDNCIFHFSI